MCYTFGDIIKIPYARVDGYPMQPKIQAARLESKTQKKMAAAAAVEEYEQEEALMCHMMKCSQVKKCHLSYEFIVCT